MTTQDTIKLVWATPNGDQLVGDMARVSNPDNQGKDATKLIKYLITNQHWSPLEMVSMCVEINTTRDIARQILRHRSFSFQEFSQRYADVSLLPPIEEREVRMQDAKNRQSSTPTDDEQLQKTWTYMTRHVYETSMARYQEALKLGIAKEVARALLPEGLTPSRMYMSGTLRSWIHYVSLRRENGTQKEHQDIAIGASNIIKDAFPAIWTAVYE